MITRRVAPAAIMLVYAIGIAGSVAAYRVSPSLWFVTPVVAWIVLRAASREAMQLEAPGVDIRELPSELRDRVRSAFAQLPEGDARRLLLGVVNQARLVFGRGESRFDAAEERQLAEHVSGLVDACCATAADLARLDQFAVTASDAASRTELVARAAKARDLFRDRLTNAASALAELYTANVERGTPSTDRVAELTAEISADASARAEAAAEMKTLLGG
ncbi:MAG TPA: hypothetical protein VJW73_22820 [Gemmatimonadaceae bacterium]|nr:hypothetical protein [Gemmatimonadaceae bacterium]